LVAINEHLSKEKEELEKESLSLKNANASLETQAEELRAKQLLLEQCSESLKLENTLLIQQFDRLKLKYEQESLSSQKQLQELKTCVTNTVQKYIHGETNLQELVFSLGEVGVEVVLPSNANIGVSAEVTKQQIEAAETVEERTEYVFCVIDFERIHFKHRCSNPIYTHSSSIRTFFLELQGRSTA
jgi:hypothetical protein